MESNPNNHNYNHIEQLEKELKERMMIEGEVDRDLLSKVDVIGFDIDHTFCLYHNANLSELMYTSFARYLVEHKNYPQSIMIFNTNDTDKVFDVDLYHSLCITEVLLDMV